MATFFSHLISKYDVRRPVTRPEDDATASVRRASKWQTASVSGEERAVEFYGDSYAS